MREQLSSSSASSRSAGSALWRSRARTRPLLFEPVIALLAAPCPQPVSAAELEAAGLVTLADMGCPGSSHAKIPCSGKNKQKTQNEANRAMPGCPRTGRAPNAQLTTWRILGKLRCCPWRAGQLAKAIHVVQAHEA